MQLRKRKDPGESIFRCSDSPRVPDLNSLDVSFTNLPIVRSTIAKLLGVRLINIADEEEEDEEKRIREKHVFGRFNE